MKLSLAQVDQIFDKKLPLLHRVDYREANKNTSTDSISPTNKNRT